MKKEDFKPGIRVAEEDAIDMYIDIVYVDDKGFFGYDEDGDGEGWSDNPQN